MATNDNMESKFVGMGLANIMQTITNGGLFSVVERVLSLFVNVLHPKNHLQA